MCLDVDSLSILRPQKSKQSAVILILGEFIGIPKVK